MPSDDFFKKMMGLSGTAGLASGLGGLFGLGTDPYENAMKQYEKWGQKAANVQNPYLEAGQGGLFNYQDWLQGMQDPAAFMNNLQGQYQESPYSQYLQRQATLGGQNAASASGLMGSTPMMQQAQSNAANIASGDLNSWLQNVLGINAQYGQGQQNLMQGGQNAANALTNLYGNMGNNMAGAAYGSGALNNQNWANAIGGAANLAGGLYFL